ncbi:uncharacterized protein LOC133123436 [Conger conger]|uniref:uncharacterized protein LOC133123436 n=1 Tax=Conger conger TaxID=82655 RepID=UPI002A59F5F8|nr:uncharacterized protein LOC133123436 [Conger conger]
MHFFDQRLQDVMMEEACSPIAKHKDPNGFVNRVFNVSLDVENVTGAVQIQDPGQGDAPASGPSQEDGERVATGRKPRTAGIWRILTRRKTTIGSERRPHSMILPGENSPQLSFVDKVRSFKKLKPPSIFKERSFKLYGVKCGSTLKDDPDIQSPSREYPGQTHSRRRPFRSKGKRHSYAGRTKEFDCSFEDVDLTRPSENNQQLPHDMSSSQNGSKGAPNSKVKAHPNFSNSNNSSAHDEHPWRDCPKTPQGGRRLRGADVWGYLRKISLMGKGSSGMSGKSFDSELHTLDKTIDSDCASADFECIRDHSPPPAAPAADSKGGHFRGLFRFFSSVAETARKWRNSAQSFSPPEGERSQLGSPCSQRSGLFAHNVPLHPGNEDKGATAMSLNSNSGEALSLDSLEQGSPQVVLRSWKTCSDSQGSNGHLMDLAVNLGSPPGSPCSPKSPVEHHVRCEIPESRALLEMETGSSCNTTEDAEDTGNYRNIADISVSVSAGPRQDQENQRDAGGTETCSNTDYASEGLMTALKCRVLLSRCLPSVLTPWMYRLGFVQGGAVLLTWAVSRWQPPLRRGGNAARSPSIPRS